jgi:SagB-type dehydrogenase family enzyme
LDRLKVPGIISLPSGEDAEGPSITSVIRRRRSIRSFSTRELTWAEVGRLVWAAQGITETHDGLRAVPSAGALYPLELDVILPSGVFRYRCEQHRLLPRSAEDIREAVSEDAYGQTWIAQAPCLLSFAAVMRRTARKYGPRSERYVHLEVGHAAQNVLLMAADLGLVGAPVGAFDDRRLAETLALEPLADPMYLVVVGWPSR